MSDLQRIFDLDPLKLTKDDIDETIAGFRAARANFNLTGAGAGPKKAKAASEKVDKIDLDDLMGGTPSGS